MSRRFGIDVGAVTTPRAQHIAQLVAVQQHFLGQAGDEALAAAYLQEVKDDHSSVVPYIRSVVKASYFPCPSAGYKGCQVIDLLFEGIQHHLGAQEDQGVRLRIEAHQDVQQSMS